MKKTIREMIRTAKPYKLLSGGLGNGEAEEAARLTTPDSGHRRVELAQEHRQAILDRASDFCRVVGFIPLSRGSNSRFPVTR